MPAVTVENPLVLPRLERPTANVGISRPVSQIVQAQEQIEGAGFRIWRPFPGGLALEAADPFLMLDQLGPTVTGPGETVGAPWHPIAASKRFRTYSTERWPTMIPMVVAA